MHESGVHTVFVLMTLSRKEYKVEYIPVLGVCRLIISWLAAVSRTRLMCHGSCAAEPATGWNCPTRRYTENC